jgi:predicted ATPase
LGGDLAGFREAVRQRRRAAGRTQQQLARGIGVHPDVLSHKLHGRALLTSADATAIVTVLAGWGAIGSRAGARALLALAGVPAQAVPAAWAGGPLGALPPGDPPASGSAPAADPPSGQAGRRLVPVPLPAVVTPLVGRAAEVAAAAAAVAGHRLVTLTGTGGTGKTRVALAAAAGLAGRFGGQVAFADLAPVGDPHLLAAALARAAGLAPPSPAAAAAMLAGALRPAELLLVADNMEHLVEAAPLLARLLAAAPGLHLLVTSRIPLGLYGEHQLRVPPLSLPGPHTDPAAAEAVQLFCARARAAGPRFDPDAGTLAAVAGICAALDGLPLAIELAAARVRLFPPQALLPKLAGRLPLLTGGPADLPPRQQTLRATLEWSEALLDPAGRALFARLGVFAGPFDAAAAAAVCGDATPDGTGDMLGQLDRLGQHGLAEVLPGEVPRFRLLTTIREYALARLAETGQADPARRRHLGHYLTVAARARAGLHGPGHGAAAARIHAALPDIGAALEWAHDQAARPGPGGDPGCLDQALQLAAAAAPAWQNRGSLAEGTHHLDRLLAADAQLGAAAPRTRAAALLEAAVLACFRGDTATATARAGQSLALFQALGDPGGQSRARRYLGEAALTAGDYPAAWPHFTAQLTLARAATVLASLAELARDSGRAARARALYQQALRVHQHTGNTRQIAFHLEGLAGVAALDQQSETALTYLGAAQALRDASGGPQLPAEQAILTRLLGPQLARLPQADQDAALAGGRTRPLAGIIAQALAQPGTDSGEPPDRPARHHRQHLTSANR